MTTIYTTGGTVRPDSPGYIERKADDDLLSALKAGEFCYVLDSRQKGKSSLMARCQLRLEESGIHTVQLDLQRFGANLDAEKWYAGLLDALGQAIDLTKELFTYWKDNLRLGPLQRFFGAIEHVLLQDGMPFVLFVDEIDFVRSLPFDTDEFFAGIRECYNRRATNPRFLNLTFCLLGVATPSELIRDVRITPFNIGRRIDLPDFSLEESMPLAKGLGSNGKEILARVLNWTGGHPYLTQKVCAIAAETKVESLPEIDRIVKSTFFAATARQEEPNLSDVSRRLLESRVEGKARDEYLAEILDLYRKVRSRHRSVKDDETDPMVAILELSGVTSVRDGYLVIRNRIYEEVFDQNWVRSNLPDAEMKRQRRTAMVAALKTGAVAALALALVAKLALNSAGLAREKSLALQESQKLVAQNAALVKSEAHALEVASAKAAEAQQNAAKAQALAFTASAAGMKEAQALRKAEQEKELALAAKNESLRNEHLAERAKRQAQQNEIQARKSAHDAYLANLKTASEALAEKRFAFARAVLRNMRSYATKELAYDYLNRLADQQTKVLEGFTKETQTVRFTPDGKEVIAASKAGEIKIWRTSDYRLVRNLQGPNEIFCSALSPDGSHYAVGTSNGVIACRSLRTFKQAWTRVLSTKGLNWLCFSPNGRLVAICESDGFVRLCRADSGKTVSEAQLSSSDISSGSFSPDGNLIALAEGTGQYTICRVPDLAIIKSLDVPGSTPESVCFSPDGVYLAGSGSEGGAYLWRSRTWEFVRNYPIKNPVFSLSFSPDGKRLLTTESNGTIAVWNTGSDTRLNEVSDGDPNNVSDGVFSPDGTSIAVCKGPVVQILPGDLSLSGDQQFLAGFPNGTLVIRAVGPWLLLERDSPRAAIVEDARTHKPLITLELPGRDWYVSDFDPHSNRISIQSGTFRGSGEVRVIDLNSKRIVCRLTGSRGIFSPDGKSVFATSTLGTITEADVKTGRVVGKFKGHSEFVTQIGFSRDGARLVTSANDGTARVWDAKSHRQLAMIQPSSQKFVKACVSPDGNYVAVTDLYSILIYTASGTPFREIVAPKCGDIQFAPDSKLIVASTPNGLRFFDVSTGTELYNAFADLGNTHMLVVSADGTIWAEAGPSTYVIQPYRRSDYDTRDCIPVDNFARPGRLSAISR